jgi:hypothetical protein
MKRNIITGLIIVMMLPLTSVAQKINFEPSPIVPSATGYVKITKDKNKNYNIKIDLINFAEVDRLQMGKSTYVVWMIANQKAAENIGQLKSGKHVFAKKAKASLETTSPEKPKKIFITAENDGKTEIPIGQVVITTKDF